MTLNLTIPQQMHTDFTPRITVIGVGGGGTNAVDNMIAMSLQGVQFVVANTDAQQLMHSRADTRIQLGPHLTQGLGAGAKPEIGRAAAEEAADEVYRHLEGAHMVFITAGMGGGTGTGAAPVIARMARERGILTVGVVTKPFSFEGTRRARAADQGIEELQQYVDTLIVIPNQNLFRLANERTGWKEAFKMADNVLYMGVRGVTDLMMAPGLVNLDFADIRTVMAEMGKAMMGTGEADGENRAIRAAEAAISNPLLEDTSMAGARGLLINITGGEDMTLFEVDQAANRIREEVDEEANIIFGSAIDDGLSGRIRVSVVATGIDAAQQSDQRGPRLVAVGGGAPIPMPMPMAQQAAPAPLPFPRAVQPAAQPLAQMGVQPGVQAGAQPAMAGVAEVMHAEPAQASLLTPEPIVAQPMAPQPAPHAQPAMAEAPQPVHVQHPMHAQPMQAQPMQAQPAYAQAQPVPQPAMHRAPPSVAQAPAAPAPAAEAAAPRGLFAAPARQAQAAAPMAPAEPRQSLFSKVTGAFRRNTVGEQVPEPARPTQMPPQAYAQPRAEAVAEPARAQVRPAGGEEMGLDIPAFLRRQN